MTEPAGTDAAPDVSIVIVSYNTRELTLACLESVYRETKRTSFEIVLLDNDSKDGSAAAIETRFPEIRSIRMNANLGFAKGCNVAAQVSTGRYVLLLNPDTVVLDGAIDRLVAFATSAPEARIWGGRTVFGDGTLNPTSCWHRMTVWNLFCRLTGLASLFPDNPILNTEAYGGWQRDTVRDVDIVTGCFLLIERKDWQLLGGFDERFFMYGEEADLCLRARRLGFRPQFTPDATIIHYDGASETVRTSKMLRLMAAKALLIRIHFNAARRLVALLLLAAWPATRAAGYGLAAIFAPGRYHASFQTWREVFSARRSWLHGYPPT